MKLKKIIALTLACASVMAFTACGSKPTETNNEPVASEPTAPSENTLVMATNAEFPPYEYYEDEKIVGIDAEIAEAIGKKLGKEVKIENMEFGAILAAIQSGKADFSLAGMTVTDDRKESVNFSDSYATGIQVIIVKEDSKIATTEDLTDKKIGVQENTTGDIYISDDETLGNKVVERYSKGADAVQALLQGKIDAVVIDNEPAKEFVKANEGLKILDAKYADEDYAIALAKDNTELLEDINKALAELKEDGTIQTIIDKYIK